MGRAKITRPGLAVLLAVLLTLALAAPASAAPPGQITCVATPRVQITPSDDVEGQWDWRIVGLGACVAGKGTLTIFITGTGTSTGLGLCTGLLVQDLAIAVTSFVERVFSGEVFTAQNLWVATITTFPVATPFAVNTADGSQTVGVGSIFSHIFLRCPGSNPGNQSSTVVWTQDFRGSGATPV